MNILRLEKKERLAANKECGEKTLTVFTEVGYYDEDTDTNKNETERFFFRSNEWDEVWISGTDNYNTIFEVYNNNERICMIDITKVYMWRVTGVVKPHPDIVHVPHYTPRNSGRYPWPGKPEHCEICRLDCKWPHSCKDYIGDYATIKKEYCKTHDCRDCYYFPAECMGETKKDF